MPHDPFQAENSYARDRQVCEQAKAPRKLYLAQPGKILPKRHRKRCDHEPHENDAEQPEARLASTKHSSSAVSDYTEEPTHGGSYDQDNEDSGSKRTIGLVSAIQEEPYGIVVVLPPQSFCVNVVL